MTGIVILAAGASSRMKKIKQLLPYQDSSLLQHSIDTARNTGFSPVIVVLGANAATIESNINITGARMVINDNWQEGQGSSVRTGIVELTAVAPAIEDAFILLCDQPFVTVGLLHQMVKMKVAAGKKIVACSYQETAGVPVLFDASLFPELSRLPGADGAKKLLTRFAEEVITIPFPKGQQDIDTPEDYERLKKY